MTTPIFSMVRIKDTSGNKITFRPRSQVDAVDDLGFVLEIALIVPSAPPPLFPKESQWTRISYKCT